MGAVALYDQVMTKLATLSTLTELEQDNGECWPLQRQPRMSFEQLFDVTSKVSWA